MLQENKRLLKQNEGVSQTNLISWCLIFANKRLKALVSITRFPRLESVRARAQIIVWAVYNQLWCIYAIFIKI